MKVVEATAQVVMQKATLTVGLVADTHSEPHRGGLEHLAAQRPDVILHAGDIGDLGVLDTLRELAPVHAVRGNIDTRVGLPDVLVLGLDEPGGQRALTVLLTHIAVLGPRIRPEATRRAKAAGASLIVCGHSHVPFLTQERGLTLFNPGSLGPRRGRLPILYGVMKLSLTGVTLEHFDCESGKRWLPGA